MRDDFRLGDWLVQPHLVRVSKDGQTVQVRAKVMDLLVYLAHHRDDVVSKDALLRDVWGTEAISESALTRTITELRQAFGDDAGEPTILETIPKRGYRLIAPVTLATGASGGHSNSLAVLKDRRTMTAIAAVGVVIVALIGVGRFWGRRPAVERATAGARLTVQPPPGVRIGESAAPTALAISPDGQWIAFRGVSDDPSRSGLYVRFTGDLEARRVSPDQFAGSPFFSRDSEWLGFVQNEAIQKVPVRGGETRRICTVGPHGIRGASWADDGTIVFSSGEGLGLRRVSADGGEPVAVTPQPAGQLHYFPHVLPGSKTALFTLMEGVGETRRFVALVSLETGQVRPLMKGTFARYVPPDVLVYRRGPTVYAVGFDPARLEPKGEERPVLEDVNYYTGSGSSAFDVSASGALAYVPGAPRASDSELAWLARDGSTQPLAAERRAYSRPSLDPGQRRVAVHIGSGSNSDLWTYEIERQAWSRRTEGLETSGRIVWSPDGRWIFFSSSRSGSWKLFRVGTEGGEAEMLTDGVYWDFPGDVHGSVVLFQRQVKPAVHDLMMLQLGSPQPPAPFFRPGVQAGAPRFSPDGRWIAYDSMEVGPNRVFVRAFPGPDPRIMIEANGGFGPRWSADGRTLFYRRDQEIWAVPIRARSAFPTIGRPGLVLRSELLNPALWQDGIEVSDDGQRFLIVKRPAPERRERLLVYVPQWSMEVQRALHLDQSRPELPKP